MKWVENGTGVLIYVGNPPMVTINEPSTVLFAVGDSISLNATVSDSDEPVNCLWFGHRMWMVELFSGNPMPKECLSLFVQT